MAVSLLRWLVAGFPLWLFRFEPRSGHVGFVVDKVALGQVFSKYLVSPVNHHSTNCSTMTIIYHLGLVQ
jgi:hypothetical protein